MFDLNETINWKPKSTGGRFGNWIKMPMTGIYLVQGSGNPIANLENRRQTRRNLIGSVEVIQRNRKVNSGGFQKETLSRIEIGNMDEENYDLSDLHKM
jgi:isoleucyl-tRNA synthetase